MLLSLEFWQFSRELESDLSCAGLVTSAALLSGIAWPRCNCYTYLSENARMRQTIAGRE
jgi:hypothetical protein